MHAALRRLRDDLRAASPGDPAKASVRNAFFVHDQPHHSFMGSLYEYDAALTQYACHPRCVGMVEEVMGCDARLTEFNGHLNTRNPNDDFSKPPQFGFHNGVDIAFGTHLANGLYHCNFIKTLTTLVDLGPDDGGTVVVAGSHKVSDTDAAIKAAYEDRSLIHQFIAPAGSTLLFAETLIHATGQMRSDKERAIIIAGYAPSMYARWDRMEQTTPYSPEFEARIPPSLRTLFLGRLHWERNQRYRKLGDPVDPRGIEPVKWS